MSRPLLVLGLLLPFAVLAAGALFIAVDVGASSGAFAFVGSLVALLALTTLLRRDLPETIPLWDEDF